MVRSPGAGRSLDSVTPVLMTAKQRELILSLARRAYGGRADIELSHLKAQYPQPSVGDGSRMIADLRRAAQAKPAATTVPAGRYALVEPDGTVRQFEVDCPRSGRWAGYVFVSRVDGDSVAPVKGQEGRAIRARIAEDPLGAAARFGTLTGVCGMCMRTLTNAESIDRGIGPVCAGKLVD